MSKQYTRKEIREAAKRIVRYYICKVEVPNRGDLDIVHGGWEVESNLTIRLDHMECQKQRRSKGEVRAAAVKVTNKFSPLEIPEKARIRKTQEGWEIKCYVYVPENEPEWFDPDY